MYSESHCHLTGDVEKAVEEARRAGVELVLAAGIDVPSSVDAIKTAEKYDIVEACVGIHPWRADEYSEEARSRLMELARRGAVAVSEIGLDYIGRMTPEWVRTDAFIDPQIQREAFRGQLRLARELGLPVLVHDRTPRYEVLDILEDEGATELGAAIHGFSKGTEYAKRCFDLGLYISVGSRPLAEGREELLEAVRRAPLDRLLTETDSGDPKGVLEVAERIAELRGLPVEEVGRAATANLRRLTGL